MLTDVQKSDYAKLLENIKKLPEEERKQVDAFAMGLAAALKIKEAKSA